MQPRFAALVMLPHRECVPHLRRILRRLEEHGGSARAVADELREELSRLERREAARRAPGLRRERVADHFVLVRADGARFVAKRRQDKGEGWALAGADGLALGNYRTLDECEAALSATP